LTIYSAIGFSVAMLILAASPGPGVFATVARALASGFRPALAVICGIVLGDIIFLLFAAFGLSMVARVLGNGNRFDVREQGAPDRQIFL